MATDSTKGGCVLLIIVLNLLFGGVSFDYCLWNIFGKDIPWYGDVACGFLAAQVTIPLSIILWILKICGVVMPLFTN